MNIALFLSAWMGWQEPTADDPLRLKPFTAGVPYLGKYETGLYPGARNEIPASHRAAGGRVAVSIRPLDVEGRPDDNDGRILAVVLGHSNGRQYFGALGRHLTARKDELHPRFELLNAAVGGQQLPEISRLQGPVWDQARKQLSRPGYSPRQVQVLFLHTTYHGASNRGRVPPRPFPDVMERMKGDLIKVLRHALEIWPHLKLAYLTSDGFRHFTGFEPHVWQESFAFKWLIEDQIKLAPGTSFEGDGRHLPWLQWGPYIWDNTWGKDMFTDGVHPAPDTETLFVEKYWAFLMEDPVARGWLLR